MEQNASKEEFWNVIQEAWRAFPERCLRVQALLTSKGGQCKY